MLVLEGRLLGLPRLIGALIPRLCFLLSSQMAENTL
jgi:hypothetical protein